MRLVSQVQDSPDPVVRNSKVQVHSGHKWNTRQAIEQAEGQAVERLKYQEIVGLQQFGRSGLGWGMAAKMWSKASQKEKKHLVK